MKVFRFGIGVRFDAWVTEPFCQSRALSQNLSFNFVDGYMGNEVRGTGMVKRLL